MCLLQFGIFAFNSETWGERGCLDSSVMHNSSCLLEMIPLTSTTKTDPGISSITLDEVRT